MKFPLTLKNRRYRLLSNSKPLSFMFPTKNTKAYSLLWFDAEKKTRRALRYASNYPTPFEDEQGENAMTPIIAFENGFLNVSSEDTALQWLLELHPAKGILYEEVDVVKEASKELEEFDMATDALIAFKNTTIEQQQHLTRIIFGRDPDTMPTELMRKELARYVKSNPKEFLQYNNDPELLFESKVRSFFDKKVLFLKGKDSIHFNTTGNKQRMVVVPLGEDPYKYLAAYFKTDDGIQNLKVLEAALENEE